MIAEALIGGAAAGVGPLLRVTLLILAVWLSAEGLRRAGASAATRHAVWLFGVAALLALPILWWSMPALRLPILPAEAATRVAAWDPALARSVASPETIVSGLPWAGTPQDAVPVALLIAIYSLVAAALLLRVTVGRRMLARLWREADPVADPEWEKVLTRLSSELGLPRPVELRVARARIMPMTWGTLAPRLLVPREALAWPPQRRRLVLLHELAHVARRDSLSRSIAAIACAFYWFHPGVWFAARQMRVEQEHAADDRVLAAGESAGDYARNLLHLASELGGRVQPVQAPSIAGASKLEHRLVSITGSSRRNRPGSLFLAASALIAILATAFVAAGVPVRHPATLPSLRPAPSGLGLPSAREVNSGPVEDRPADATLAPMRATADRVRSMPASLEPEPATLERQNASENSAPRPVETADAATPPPQAPAYSRQIPDYGWQLERRDPQEAWRKRLQQDAAIPATGTTAETSAYSRSVRPALPRPSGPDSGNRTPGPRGSRVIPRLVLEGTPAGASPAAPSAGTVMLSWLISPRGRK